MGTFKKNIKYFIGLLLIGGLVWFAYDIHFKFVINEYQGNQIEKQLKSDFESNTKGFEKLSEYQAKIGNISNLQFSKTDDYISFEIKSDSLTSDNYSLIQISAGDKTENGLEFIGISENKGIIAEIENEQFTIEKNWKIFFNGKKSNPVLNQILSLKNIDLKSLNTIEKLLNETNSIGFEKNDSIIQLRYAGHWGESYNYVKPIRDLTENENWDELSDGWYSFHYVNGLYCGYTD